jgi:hypothetical protein
VGVPASKTTRGRTVFETLYSSTLIDINYYDVFGDFDAFDFPLSCAHKTYCLYLSRQADIASLNGLSSLGARIS